MSLSNGSSSFVVDFNTVIIDRDFKENNSELIKDRDIVKEFSICSVPEYESTNLNTVLKPPSGCTMAAQSERVQIENDLNCENGHGIPFEDGETDYFALYDLLVHFFESCGMQSHSDMIVIFVQNESKMRYLLAFEPVVQLYFNYPLIQFCNLAEAGFEQDFPEEDVIGKRFAKCTGIMQKLDKKHKSCALQRAYFMAHWTRENTGQSLMLYTLILLTC